MLTKKDFQKQAEVILVNLNDNMITDRELFKIVAREIIVSFIEFNYIQNKNFPEDKFLDYLLERAEDIIIHPLKREDIKEVIYYIRNPL